jgi:hypothetical protein
MSDKPDECGCHRGCTTLPHDCANPCQWPTCLTEAEAQQLADDVMAEEAAYQRDAVRHSHDPVSPA